MKNRGKMLQRSNRIEKFVDDVKSITRLDDFGKYLTFLLELNIYTLNVNRNFFDISLIRKEDGCYLHIAKLNGRICGAKRSHSVFEQPNCYQSV